MLNEAARGTVPPKTEGEAQASSWVRQMFSDIAPKYDQLNHLLSFNVDRTWRKALLKELSPVLERPDAVVLDLCCGTGDVMLDLQSKTSATILGADFCHPMLLAARKKLLHDRHPPYLFEGDALNLPVADASFDGIAIAFGFRNLANYQSGLQELHRVLKPGGILAILEFSHPRELLMRTAYGFYSRFALPLVGAMISGSRAAYSYLPDSIKRFPKAEELRNMMKDAGFAHTRFELLTGGVAALHLGLSARQRW